MSTEVEGVPADELTQIRRSRAYLSTVAGEHDEQPAAELHELIAQVGPVEAAISTARLARQAGKKQQRAGEVRAVADETLDAIAKLGGRLVIPEDDEWPHDAFGPIPPLLREEWAPIALWVRGTGHLDELADGAVAVVGARAATPYGMHVATELATALADAGVTVVTGDGNGTDGAAQKGALVVEGGRVVVVQVCGLDRTHRLGEARLVDQVAQRGGVVVSMAPPGASASATRYLAGSRLVAALACGTVVVEAASRSRSLETATAARAFGRVVMAVPGPITSGMSEGCHRLIQDGGAVLVTGGADVLSHATGTTSGPRIVGSGS